MFEINRTNLKDYYSPPFEPKKIRTEEVRDLSLLRDKFFYFYEEYTPALQSRISELLDQLDSLDDEKEKKSVQIKLQYLINKLNVSDKNVSLDELRHRLDNSHHGLERAKETLILAYANYCLSKSKTHPFVILFDGAPGCGKTSLARAFSEALSWGDLIVLQSDTATESELGVYGDNVNGAEPSFIGRADSYQKVVLIDEIEKGKETLKRGLHSLLDGGNKGFRDNFLECCLPVKEMIFILTSNDRSLLDSSILDRCNFIVEFENYKEEDLLYLIDFISKEIGMQFEKTIVVNSAAKDEIVRYVGGESSARHIKSIIRELVLKKMVQENLMDAGEVTITSKDVFLYTEKEQSKTCIGFR